MGITQCGRCGGQISTNSTNCPWCGHSTSFNALGPLVLVLVLLVGASFAVGLVRWGWLERTLGLDRGFVEQVADADAEGGGTGQGDLSWRLPPGPDPANNYRGGSGGTATAVRSATPDRPVIDRARVDAVAQAVRRSAPPNPEADVSGCADSSAVGRLIAGYPGWSNNDLVLIACGRIRSGFSGAQVRAARGKPSRVEASGPGRERWIYADFKVIMEQGRVISFGQ